LLLYAILKLIYDFNIFVYFFVQETIEPIVLFSILEVPKKRKWVGQEQRIWEFRLFAGFMEQQAHAPG